MVSSSEPLKDWVLDAEHGLGELGAGATESSRPRAAQHVQFFADVQLSLGFDGFNADFTFTVQL